MDLLYRGRKQLINGTITVDLNKESTANGSTMIDGTYEALCKNPQIFLQNNETFDRLKGTIDNSILSIICENTSASNYIEWMVISERKDPSILCSTYTDNTGSLILEHDNNFTNSNYPPPS